METTTLMETAQRQDEAFSIARRLAVTTLRGEAVAQQDLARFLRIMSDQAKTLGALAQLAAAAEKSAAADAGGG